MKSLASIVLIATCLRSGLAQITMDVYTKPGKKVGTARVTLKEHKGGSDQEVRTKLDSTRGAVELITQSMLDPNAKPIQEIYTMRTPVGSSVTTLTYGRARVRVVLKSNGQQRVTDIAIPRGAKLANPSDLWFVRTQPKVGEQHTYWRVLSTGKGSFITAKYEGKQQVKIGKKAYAAHRVVYTDSVQWMDDKGMPVKIQLKNPALLFERR